MVVNGTGESEGDVYFESDDVLDRVPTVLYAMSGLYLGGMLLGKEMFHGHN